MEAEKRTLELFPLPERGRPGGGIPESETLSPLLTSP